LKRARRIAIDEGLRYVLHRGTCMTWRRHTFCRGVRQRLDRARLAPIESYRLTADGNCPDCGAAIPGRFVSFDKRQQFGRRRIPVSISRD